MRLLVLSWRNLWRNRRRSLLVGSSMFMCVFIMIVMIGFTSGMVHETAQTATGTFLGHIHVRHALAGDEPGLHHRVEVNQVAALSDVLGQVEEVQEWTARLTSGGLMSKKVPDPPDDEDLGAFRRLSSEGVLLLGIDPARERRVTTLHELVQPDDERTRCYRGCVAALAELYLEPGLLCRGQCEGPAGSFTGPGCGESCQRICRGRCPAQSDSCAEEDCLERCRDYCPPARFLADEDPFVGQPYRGEAVLGSSLAKVANVGVGDRVAITTATARGRPHGMILRVAGIVKTRTSSLNRSLVLTHHETLAAGLEMPGGATAIVIKTDDLDRSAGVAREISAHLSDHDAVAGLSALSWLELVPDLATFFNVKLGGAYVMFLVFTLVVAVIVANVVTMTVLERTREYGVRMAMGETPGRIIFSVLLESLVLAAFASAAAIGAGTPLLLHLERNGVDIGTGDMDTAGVLISSVFHPRVDLQVYAFALGCLLLFTVVGTLYPAWRIRRIKPVDAIHFV